MINGNVIAVRIGIVCIDEEWGRKTMEDFCTLIPDDWVQCRRKDRIDFKDGSSIKILRMSENVIRGNKFDKIFVQQGISDDIIDKCVRPCLVNKNNRVYKEFIDEETRQKCFL